MKSDCQPEGENSRRSFIQKLGTLAAASSMAAGASAQQPPAGGPGAADLVRTPP